MNLKESKFLASTTRGALIDLLESEIIDVEDKIGTVNFIKETTDSKVLELAQFAMTDGNISREFSIQYSNYLKTKNDSFPIINEKEYNDRLSIYLSEDSGQKEVLMSPDDIKRIILGGSFTAILSVYLSKPTEFRKAVNGLKQDGVQLSKKTLYAIAEVYRFQAVRVAKKKVADAIKKGATPDPVDVKTASMNIRDMVKLWKKVGSDIKKDPVGVLKSTGKQVGTIVAKKAGIFAGAVALAIGAQQVYQRFFSQAAKACNKLSGKDKTACMLKFKVAAAHKAMEQLNAQKGKCPQSKDPEKCIYYVNRELWQWQKKMKAYQAKLISMGHQEETKKSDTKKHPFD